MKIALAIPSLSGGGAERILSLLANEWAKDGHQLSIFTWDDGSEPPFFPLNPSIRLHPLSLKKISRFQRLSLLRRSFRESSPDVVISFMERSNILTLLSLLGTGIPVIVSERTDPSFYPTQLFWRLLRSTSYPWARHVVFQTEEAKQYFGDSIQEVGEVIPNPVLEPAEPSLVSMDLPTPCILSVGALRPEKGHDVLINSFALIASRHPAWHLVLVGEGSERSRLEVLAKQAGLKTRIHFKGEQKQAESYMAKADIFVLPSRFEGFPNALCQAMALGRPVIAASGMGPRAIIQPGVDGILFEPGDEEALARKMDRLIVDGPERDKLGKKAREIVERFPLKSVLESWNRLLADL